MSSGSCNIQNPIHRRNIYFTIKWRGASALTYIASLPKRLLYQNFTEPKYLLKKRKKKRNTTCYIVTDTVLEAARPSRLFGCNNWKFHDCIAHSVKKYLQALAQQ
jgi:hypothetical protein